MICWQSLHQSYEDWLIHKTSGPLPAPVLLLDADQGIDNMIRTYETYEEEIRGRKPYVAPGLGQSNAWIIRNMEIYGTLRI